MDTFDDTTTDDELETDPGFELDDDSSDSDGDIMPSGVDLAYIDADDAEWIAAELAEVEEADEEAKRRALTFVVVGGGYAGTETIAAAIPCLTW